MAHTNAIQRRPRRPRREPPRGVLAVLLAAVLLAAPSSPAQVAPAAPGEHLAEIADLEVSRAEIDADTSLAEDLKTTLLEVYDRAIKLARDARSAEQNARALEERVAAAPQRIEELQATLDRAEVDVERVQDDARRLELPELVATVQEKGASLAAARDQLKARESALAALTAAGARLADVVAEQQRALRELSIDPAVGAGGGEAPVLIAARGALAAARADLTQAELRLAQYRLANYDLLVRLATLERDALATEIERLDLELVSLEKLVEERRARDARQATRAAEVAQAAASVLPDAVAEIAGRNAELREELERITADDARVTARLRDVERRSSELDANLVAVRQRVELIGPTEAIGRLLRRRLEGLPIAVDHVQRARARERSMVDATDRRIDIEELQRQLGSPAKTAEVRVAGIPDGEIGFDEREALVGQAQALLEAQQETLEALHRTYGRYITQLTLLHGAEAALDGIVRRTIDFIRQELIWIRSLPTIAVSDVAHFPTALAAMLDRERWRELLDDVVKSLQMQPRFSTGTIAALALLLLLRPWARRRLAAIADKTRRIRTDRFRYTLEALVYTAVVASAGPLILTAVGWHVRAEPFGTLFSAAVGEALLVAGQLLIVFSAAYWVAQPDGLARRHFRWPEAIREGLLRELRWLPAIFVACGFLVQAMNFGNNPELMRGLGRPALIVAGLALIVFVWRFFSASGAVMRELNARHASGMLVRTWRLWFLLLLMAPTGLVVAAVLGYYYTATQLLALLIETLWIILGLLLLRDVLLRWFSVTERRIRFEAAVQSREAARAEREKASSGADAEMEDRLEVEQPEVNYRSLGHQARSVIQVGVLVGVVLSFGYLWGDLLPALNVLEEVTMPVSRVVTIDGVEQEVPVTLAGVLVALLLIGGGLFAARNLSGVLEFTVLQRLRLDPGASYAVVTLCQYLVIAVTLVYALSQMGLQWSKLQWLVAALGVGLGFGLQEIVANFVSGIILLLERPVRVGDVVTVGNTDGTVARIRIRATTIVTWERKELIVPNKEFITSRVLNWTLSDSQTRLFISVGIAYGSDVREARELVLEAAAENEHLLTDPAPNVTFASFGDSALVLELRCYLPSLDNMLTAKTALHDAIYEKFEQAGIVIAFPQQDIHLDTTQPLEIRLQAGEGPTMPPRDG